MTVKKILYSLLSAWQTHHLTVLFLSVLCLVGCSQRELCYDHSHDTSVKIEFDWSEAPDATPQTMVVYFFPTDNSRCTRIELTGGASGFNSTIKVPVGTYHVVCHNGETENNEEVGEFFSDYHLTTYETDLLAPLNRTSNAPRPDETEEQLVRAQASPLYSYTVDGSVVLEPSANKTIIMRPRRSTTVINVTIDNVQNITPGVEFCGVISGLAESWYPSTGTPGGRNVIVPLLLVPDGNSRLRGSVEVFGDNAPHDIRHKFRLYTSQKYYYDFDVTDQIHSAPDLHNVNIILSDVKLPDNGDGMDVSVGGWEKAEDVEIVM